VSVQASASGYDFAKDAQARSACFSSELTKQTKIYHWSKLLEQVSQQMMDENNYQ